MTHTPLRIAGLALLLCVGFVLLGANGCLTGPGEPDVEEGIATVDTLIAPARIAPSDTLGLRLRGIVGPNGCYSLARIETERGSGQLTVTPVVRYKSGPGTACTTAIVPLNATHRVAPPFAEGTLRVVVPQPDQADVTATIDVRSSE